MREESVGVGRLLTRAREGGLSWIWRRLAFEAATPTTAPGVAVHGVLRRGLGALMRPLRRADPGLADHLFAFYDLRVAPITYDFLWFLAAADLARRSVGAASIHVVVVPGEHGGLRRERSDYEDVVAPSARWQRLFNITLPAISLLPAATGFTLAGSRRQAAALRNAASHVYPSTYEPALPVFSHPSECLDAWQREGSEIAVLRAPQGALQAIDRYLAARLDGRRLVTITLRHYAYMPARNSDLAEWTAFARRLDPERWLPIVVPDTNQTLDGALPDLAGLEVCAAAAWNLPLRMALYERAELNLGVNCGPMGLCWLNASTRYVTFRMVTPSVPQSTVAYNRSLGFEHGRSLPFATPFQKWLWDEPDTAERIRAEFDAMVALIDQSGAPAPPASYPASSV